MTKKKKTLEEQKAELQEKYDAKIAKIDARLKAEKAREKKAERARDTRRKIIIGGLCQKHMNANPQSDFAHTMKALLEEYTISDNDRALLRLELLPKEEQLERRNRHKAERKAKDQ